VKIFLYNMVDMKKIFVSLLFLCVAVCVFAQNRAEAIRQNLLNHNTEKVTVVSHRGDWRGFPENSIEGLNSTIKMGVDVVEMDVQKTKDGVLILSHDATLDRCTTGKGKISDWTLDSIRTLNLKNGCAIKTKCKVPTLEEALMAAKGKIMLNLDKADRYFDLIYPLLVKTGTARQIIMKGSMKPQTVSTRFGQYLNDVLYMPIINLDKPNAEQEIEDFMSSIHPVAFELLFVKDSNLLPKRLAKTLKGRTLIWYNTLWDTMAGGHDDDMALEDIDGAYGYLIRTLGARILQTDRPAYLIDYLQKNHRHD
jgi:glycerophosphoryl diester phosphodiesterase